MGMKVQNDMSILKGQNLSGVNFNHGNEYVLRLMDNEGVESRVRISADLKRILDQYAEVA